MSKTYKSQFESAMTCETKEQAEKWLLGEIESYYLNPKFKGGEVEARNIILSNLGYMAGYYDASYAKKINELFGAVHPIFGTSDYHGKITTKEAFQAGVKLAHSNSG